jgi:hypothetical protein
MTISALASAVASCGGKSSPNADSAVSGSSSERSLGQMLDDRRAFLKGLPTDAVNQACTNNWKPLVSDQKLDIVVANGYFDNEWRGGLLAGDDLYRSTLISHLTESCVSGYNACGFQIKEDNLFENRIVLGKTTRGRSGEALQVSVTITNSSYSMFDDDNRTVHLQKQKEKTRLAKAVFDRGIKEADIVYYFGHARDGGGPDFNFPVLRSGSNIHVNYDWYHANRPGIKDLVSQLGHAGNRIKMLGLFACASKPHFHRTLTAAAPNLGLIESDDVIGSEPLRIALVGALDAAIGQKCSASFQKSIDLDPTNKVRLVNFFN